MIAVTGASGHLGRLAIEALLARGVPAGEIVAVVRTPEKVADLAGRGVQVRRAAYEAPDALRAAFRGVDKVYFISGSEVGQRIPQHRNVIEAAKASGVGLVVYTSAPHADTAEYRLAEEHRETERMIRESGVPYVILRNGWYMENYTRQIAEALEHGGIFGCAGEGRVSAATRADLAEAAAVVLTTPGHEGKTYELGGDEAFTMAEFAAELSRQADDEVVYKDFPFDNYVKVLVSYGVPEPFARLLADSDLGVGRGELYIDTGDLSRLLGRPATTMKEAIAAALRSE